MADDDGRALLTADGRWLWSSVISLPSSAVCPPVLVSVSRRSSSTRPLLLLDSDKALAKGLAALGRADPLMAALIAAGAKPALRKREPGFHGLAGIVMGQQLSVASAAAIWGRLTLALDPLHAEAVLAASDDTLRAAGLSGPKIRALRAIAEAVRSGALPLEALATMEAEAAHAALTAVKGFGPWTADVYLLFCLGHPDIFPAGDLALQEAARLALRMRKRPDERKLRKLAARWQPWRGVAAMVLWSHYRIAKGRAGAPLVAKTETRTADAA
jgi:DNA-3-methyladenine glycosylase II